MKLGIVFEGGASRSFFSCGVMDALLEENIFADYVIGVSAGIANGVSYVSRQHGRNIAIGTRYLPDKRYMGARHLLNKKNHCYYNLSFVFDEIPNKLMPFDYDTFAAFNGDVIAVCTNIETGEAEYLPVPADDKQFITLRASCALPILFQPIEIGGKKYLDGGLANPIPFEKAIQDGCDKVIVVLTRERGYVRKGESAQSVINMSYRNYPKLLDAMKNRPENYNSQREKLQYLERKKQAFVIDPIETAGFKRTESNPVKIREIYDQGVSRTRAKLEALREYLSAE